jgi:hypothetical protein
MRVEKRTLNWLPRASISDEMDAAREKRRAYIKQDLANAASLNSSLIYTNTASTDSVNLTFSIAAQRIRSGTTPKV